MKMVRASTDDSGANTYRLGQAVRYAPGHGSAIPGLVDGRIYYVIAPTNEFDFAGDSRSVDEQVIRLARTEAEARSGVPIALGPAAGTDHRLVALHGFDPGMTAGVGADVEGRRVHRSKATGGVVDTTAVTASVTKTLDKTLGDRIFHVLTTKDSLKAGKGNSGAKSKPAVVGAFAFMYGEHDVSTDLGPGAGRVERRRRRDRLHAREGPRLQPGRHQLDGRQAQEEGRGALKEKGYAIAVTIGIFERRR